MPTSNQELESPTLKAEQMFISVANNQTEYTENVRPVDLFHVNVYVAFRWNVQAGFIRDLNITSNVSGDNFLLSSSLTTLQIMEKTVLMNAQAPVPQTG